MDSCVTCPQRMTIQKSCMYIGIKLILCLGKLGKYLEIYANRQVASNDIICVQNWAYEQCRFERCQYILFCWQIKVESKVNVRPLQCWLYECCDLMTIFEKLSWNMGFKSKERGKFVGVLLPLLTIITKKPQRPWNSNSILNCRIWRILYLLT